MCILVKDLFVLLLHDVSKADLLLLFLSLRWEMCILTYWKRLILDNESLLCGELMHRSAAQACLQVARQQRGYFTCLYHRLTFDCICIKHRTVMVSCYILLVSMVLAAHGIDLRGFCHSSFVHSRLAWLHAPISLMRAFDGVATVTIPSNLSPLDQGCTILYSSNQKAAKLRCYERQSYPFQFWK